jgi:hypothetical protein
MGLQLHVRVQLGCHRGALESRKDKGGRRQVRWSEITRLCVHFRIRGTLGPGHPPYARPPPETACTVPPAARAPDAPAAARCRTAAKTGNKVTQSSARAMAIPEDEPSTPSAPNNSRPYVGG